jgi:hypothetical protein
MFVRALKVLALISSVALIAVCADPSGRSQAPFVHTPTTSAQLRFVGTHVAIGQKHAPNEPLGSQQTPNYTFIGTHVPANRAQHASNNTASGE